MALTLDQNRLMRMSDGSKWKMLGRISFDSNYQTGGMLLEPDTLNLRQIDSFSVTGTEQGFMFEFDYVSNKVKVFAGAGTASGSNSMTSGGTPSGTNASVSGGTPTGTNASVSAGTPVGGVTAPTFTGNALPTHDHDILQTLAYEETVAVVANVAALTEFPVLMTSIYADAGGSVGVKDIIPSTVAPGAGQASVENNFGGSFSQITFNAGDAVTSAIISYVNYAGLTNGPFPTLTPSGTISAPTFIGAALPGHTHTLTGDPLPGHTHGFSGVALAAHTHTFTGSGIGASSEVLNGTDLSFLTNVEFEVIGL